MRFLDDFIWRSLSPQSRETLKASLRFERAWSSAPDVKPYPKRKPPEAGMAVPAVSPKGPLPKQGGAEAPIAFE